MDSNVEILKIKTMMRIQDLVKYFGLDLYRAGKRLIGPCPIHGGDNIAAFNINVGEGDDYYGNWFCNTNKCHERFGGNIIGFTYGMLSKDGANYDDTLHFLEEFTSGIKINPNLNTKDNVIEFFQKTKKNKAIISRDAVRKRLQIPADYYMDKGFSDSVLKEFDVGTCLTRGMPMFNRAVFPIYDENEEMVGCAGRDIAGGGLDGKRPKWLYSKGFNCAAHLFNYHRALKRVREVGAIILVEGQGDVLNLYQNGIINCVGIFGSHLSDAQCVLLEKSGALTLVLAFDNDPAGQGCTQSVTNKMGRLFNIKVLEFPGKDIGDLTKDQIDNILKPQLKGLS